MPDISQLYKCIGMVQEHPIIVGTGQVVADQMQVWPTNKPLMATTSRPRSCPMESMTSSGAPPEPLPRGIRRQHGARTLA
uniref:Uncharacterized protein n=1 Tax=Pseudomonas putida TaxID=303 RepID=A0A6B7PZ02_PSEPU|nr:hypothetical protein [Pseudomonas putida]